MQPVTRVFVCLLIGASVGCARWDKLQCCPVYFPNETVIGSEAIRQGPCGPDEIFHGLKKTCWREWPAEWQAWPACGELVPNVLSQPQLYVAPQTSLPTAIVNETGTWTAPATTEPSHVPTTDVLAPVVNSPATETPEAADTIDTAPSVDTIDITPSANTPNGITPSGKVSPPDQVKPAGEPLATPFEQSSWLQPTVPKAELNARLPSFTSDVIEIEQPDVRTYYQRRVSWRPPKPAKLRR